MTVHRIGFNTRVMRDGVGNVFVYDVSNGTRVTIERADVPALLLALDMLTTGAEASAAKRLDPDVEGDEAER